MQIKELHNWPTNPQDAEIIQNQFCDFVIKESCFDKLDLLTAVDTAYDSDLNVLYAAAVTMKYPELTEIEKVLARADITCPYVPSLLAFREGPVILKVLSRLKTTPDMVMFAGHGRAHPLSFGMASHLGLLLNMPSIGCARKSLGGQYDLPGNESGQYNILTVSNIECGYVYRSRTGVNPIYISPGHKCNLEDSLKIVINCLEKYRIPQPLRLAHLYANKFRRASIRKQLTNNNIANNSNQKRETLSR